MTAETGTKERLSTPKSEFLAMLEKRWSQGLFLCVGLDSDLSKIPNGLSQYKFNKTIIDATSDLVCAFKPNSAFYEAELNRGGMKALVKTVDYIHSHYPGIPVILDAKKNDIGSTAEQYARAVFDEIGVDAVTLNPYLAKEAMMPFLERQDKGNIYLVKTSNPGAGEFQDLPVGPEQIPLYQVMACHIAESWNFNGNCGVVVGATKPRELGEVRELIGDMPILVPGLGKAQGGRPEDLPPAFNVHGTGIIANLSRGIIYPEVKEGERFADAVRREALKWHDAILQARAQA